MTDAELGFFHRCLNRSWINNGLPADPAELARLLKVTPAYLRKVWERVGQKFSEVDGRLVNPRQELERSKAISKSEQAASAATKSHADGLRPQKFRRADGALRAQARADSDSVAGFEFRKSEVETETLDESDVLFQQFLGIFVAAGVAMNERDRIRCAQMWVSIAIEDQRKIVPDVLKKSTDGSWPTASKTRRPWNYLEGQEWTRTAMPRALPIVRRSVGDDVQEQAERMFLERQK